MKYQPKELQAFWEAARMRLPLVIMGGGRWGKVWVSVASSARGSGKNISIVSREHAAGVRHWLDGREQLRHVEVVQDIRDVVHHTDKPVIAIIASRPRDHVFDAFELLKFGSNILVEKPISDDTTEAFRMLAYANEKKLVVGVATEFAYLPALHYIADRLRQSAENIHGVELIWTDPVDEVRYNEFKRQHLEISVLEDLLPHFVSLINIVIPASDLKFKKAYETGASGELTLTDPDSRIFQLRCDKAAGTRTRCLRIVGDNMRIILNFESDIPTVIWNEQEITIPSQWLYFDSTLRLELGAFNLSVTQRSTQCPLVSSARMLLGLHDELQSCLARNQGVQDR